MKKLILSILLCTMVGVATAQNYSDKSFREQKRSERRAAQTAQLAQAIKTQSFTFTATTMQANFGGEMQVPLRHNYLTVYPDVFEINLPYLTQFAVVNTPLLFDYTSNNYTINTYEGENNWIVIIKVDSPLNAGQTPMVPNMSYTMHFSIYKGTGLTTLTITPSMSDAMTYEGFVNAN